MDTKSLIFDLCRAMGVSGDEAPVAKVIKEYITPYAELGVDVNGNVFATLGNKSADKTILLDAHADRIGFMVTEINDNGFAKVDRCGGIDIRTLQDSELVLQSNPDVSGVVCCMPPHLIDGKEDKATPISKTWVDFGMSVDELKNELSVGDLLTYKTEPKELLGNRVTSPALDDRCGVAALIKVAELLSKEQSLDYKVIILFSTQEETYGTGAKTGSFSVDADEVISVDVSFASQPDVSGMYGKIKLGGGAMICISPILSREMSQKLISVAEQNALPFQLEPISGTTGTNADHISVSKSGVKTAVLSIPQRYMHTPVEVIDIADVDNTARLIVEYIKCGGAF